MTDLAHYLDSIVGRNDFVQRLPFIVAVDPLAKIEMQSDVQLGMFARVLGCNKSRDRKSTRLNSSHVRISYAVFCLKKKNRITRNVITSGASMVAINCQELMSLVAVLDVD